MKIKVHGIKWYVCALPKLLLVRKRSSCYIWAVFRNHSLATVKYHYSPSEKSVKQACAGQRERPQNLPHPTSWDALSENLPIGQSEKKTNKKSKPKPGSWKKTQLNSHHRPASARLTASLSARQFCPIGQRCLRISGKGLCSKEIKLLANPTVRIYFICMQIY